MAEQDHSQIRKDIQDARKTISAMGSSKAKNLDELKNQFEGLKNSNDAEKGRKMRNLVLDVVETGLKGIVDENLASAESKLTPEKKVESVPAKPAAPIAPASKPPQTPIQSAFVSEKKTPNSADVATAPEEDPAASYEDFKHAMDPKGESKGFWGSVKIFGLYLMYRSSKIISSSSKKESMFGRFFKWLGIDSRARIFTDTIDLTVRNKRKEKPDTAKKAIEETAKTAVPTDTAKPAEPTRTEQPKASPIPSASTVPSEAPVGKFDLLTDTVTVGGMTMKLAGENDAHVLEINGKKIIAQSRVKQKMPFGMNEIEIDVPITRTLLKAGGLQSAIMENGVLKIVTGEGDKEVIRTFPWEAMKKVLETTQQKCSGTDTFPVEFAWTEHYKKDGKEMTENKSRILHLKAVTE